MNGSKKLRGSPPETCEPSQSIELITGPVSSPRTFKFTSPASGFQVNLNTLMLMLSQLLEKIEPTEEAEASEFYNLKRVSGDTDVTENDDVVLVDATSGAVSVSLPSCVFGGKLLMIVKVDASANHVTVSCYGLEQIQGSSSLTLSNQYDKASLLSDGVSQWLKISTGQV
jgi:hypothetical protein